MPESYFVCGTDTGVGKTRVACAMLAAAGAAGARTIGLKPVASGCVDTGSGLRNDDACQLRAAMNQPLSYVEVNPLALAPAIAPHLALARCGQSVTVGQLRVLCAPALSRAHDFLVVEGAGGWRVPLNESETLADLARALGFPVVLVVGLRLGCINHALLSADAIRADGLRLAGWVANQIDPAMDCLDENIATLDAMLGAPRLGLLPHCPGMLAAAAAACLDLGLLRADSPA